MDTKLSTNRKLKRMFANILSIVVILALAFPVTGSAQAMSKPLSLEQDEAIKVAQSDLPLGISSQSEGPLNLTWLQVNADGFGDSQNQQVPSLAVFGEYLYAGVWHWDNNSEISKAQIWRTADGHTWDQVNQIEASGAAALIVYNGFLYSGSWDGKVWRSQDGLDWEYIVNNGFDGNSNGIARFAVFNNTLYASTWGDGSQIWRTTNGTDWELFAEAGLGDPYNAGAIASEVFNGYLYWGVGNWVTGAQLWRTDGVSTEVVITDSFGSIDSSAISSLAAFGGYLYAGVWNQQGIQVWRSSDGVQWEPTNWVGTPTGQPTSALEVYENQLYLVTGNDATGLEVWRTATGDAWEQIATNGFGDANNQWSYWDNATAVFGDKLYVATNNFASGGEVWQLSMLPVEIRWFVGLGTGSAPEQQAAQQKVVDDFNLSHPKIHLTIDFVDNGIARDVLAQQIADGNPPDIVGPVGFGGSNAFHDQWLDLTELIATTGYDTSQFSPELMALYQTDVGQEGLPFAVFPSAIYYNPALFDNAGLNYPPSVYGDQYKMPGGEMVDWNWDTLTEVSKLLTLDSSWRNSTNPDFDPNNIVQYGFSFGWENHPNYWGSFWQAGTMVNGSGPYTASAPDSWKDAWGWMYNGMWGDQPFIPAGEAYNNFGGNVLNSGQVAMVDIPSWYLCCLGDLVSNEGTFQFAAMPAYNGVVSGRVDADTFRIMKTTANPEEAFEVLTYLVGPAVDTLLIGSGELPPAYGGISALANKQDDFVAAQSAQFPFVTPESWDVLLAGLDYPDTPNAEGWMPNYDAAWGRGYEFTDMLQWNSALNLDYQIACYERNLESIFNGEPATECRNPRFDVRANNDQIGAWEWLPGDELALAIDDPHTEDINPDYTAKATVNVSPDDPHQANASFDLRGSYDIQPGDIVTLSTDLIEKRAVVTNLAFTEIDIDADTVSGIAPPGSPVNLWACDSNNCINRHVIAEDGTWMADFAHPGAQEDEQNTFNIISNTWVDSVQYDEDSDTTMFGQNTPSLVIFPEWEWFDGLNWPDGATVTITVAGKDVCETTKESWGGFFNGNFNNFDNGCNIEIGDVVTFSDGVTHLTHTVQNLSIIGADDKEDTITGTADEGVVVNVWPHETGQQLQATAGGSGIWQVDFTDLFDVKVGSCGRSEIRDATGNATAVDWCVPWPPSTFIVNTTDDNDDGTCDEVHCSLREALNTSNARIVPDTITFNIPGNAPYTIQPRSPLPNINDPVAIDGTTQLGYDGTPIIELDGTYAGEWVTGLVIATNNSTVKGLVINRFGGEGLAIYGSENVVQDNYFGTDVTGTTITSSASGPEYGAYQLEVAVACSTYVPGTDRDGFISESSDALAPWAGTSVTFKGTNECGIPEPDTFEGAPLIYRYKLVFDDPNTELTSIAVSGAAFNGGAFRILDENMVVLGTAYNWGGNSFQTNYVRLFGVVGRVFYIEEYDFSSDWRYRQNIVINGVLPLGNRGNGVLIAGGATANTVSENLISGNRWNGVGIFNPGTTGNVVQENYIGTNVMGIQALGNGAAGVGIGDQAYNNFIIGNLISGNRSDGVSIFNPGTNGNTLQGNNIGTDINREVAIPNGSVGIWIGEGASDTVIGGNDASTRNVISGNKWGGVSINHLETIGTRVTGNYIGTNKNGDNALPNGGDGIYISGSQSIVSGNVISGNTASGVSMGWSATGNLVQNNYIGTDVTGTTTSGTAGPTVGDYTLTVMLETCPIYPAETDFGGFVSASEDPLKPWSGTSVSFKGTDECTGREMLGAASLIYRYKLEFAENTALTSIAVSGAAFNGPDNVLRVLDENMNVLGTVNTFGGNSFQTPIVELQNVTGKVFYVEEFDTSSTWRFRQSIVINGPLPLGNLGSGVNFHDGATHNQVIGNLISGNRSDAVSLYHTNTTGNILQGNYIGTDVSGSFALPNTSAAVWIGEGASNTLIGGTEEGQGNLISGNTGDAISINNSETTGTIIQGNFIGTDATGTASIPNQSNGIVLVTGTHDNLIGGIEPGAGNTIAFNKGTGILYADAGTGNAALSNSVFSNGWLGIELGGDGVTRNDRLDQDTGPNNLQNYPIITAVKRFDTTVTIQGLLPSTPQTTFRVEFFRNDTCDSSGFGEGGIFIGFAVVKTNPAGVGRFDVTLPVSLPQGTFVTATATDPAGNTSEFSRCFTPAPGWNQVNDSGFGNPATNGVSALENFQGQLYAGASNWETGGQIWRLGQDGLWRQVNEAGFGGEGTNPAIIDLAIFQDQLYASTGWGGTRGQVWRSANGTNWQPVTTDGFGEADNSAITSFVVFKNMLYAGTGTSITSAQIWRSSTGKSGSWKQVAPDGSGLAGNITGFAIYKNILYAAVEPVGGLGAPIQVWRSVDGSAWTTVIPDGFGDGNNVSTGGFAQFGGYLYLGTRNDNTGAQLWRTNDGIHWVQVVNNGFGDSNNIKIESLLVFNDLLYAVTYNWAMGLQVWRSTNGQNWEQVGANGFGDSANSATLWNSATVVYQGQLVIGTWNNNEGGEVWQLTP